MDLVDLEFLELGCLAGKNWSGAVFVDLELRGALPNTPYVMLITALRMGHMVGTRHSAATANLEGSVE
jgi:hypothetical protein